MQYYNVNSTLFELTYKYFSIHLVIIFRKMSLLW